MQKLHLEFQSPSVRSLVDSENSLVYRETQCPYTGGAAAAVGTTGQREHPIQSRAPMVALRATASLGRQEKRVSFGRAAQQLKHWLQKADLSDLCGGSHSLGHHRPTRAREQEWNTSKWILLPSNILAMLTEWTRSPSSFWCFYRQSNKMHKYSLEFGLESRLFLCPGVNNLSCHSLMVKIPIKKILNSMFRSYTRWEDPSSLAQGKPATSKTML